MNVNQDNKKKKVLFLINTLRDGGAEKILVDIVNNLDINKYDIEVKLIYRKGVYLNRLNDNIKLSFISDFGSFKSRIVSHLLPILSSESLYKLFIKGKYDTEVAFLEGYATKIIAGAPSNVNKLAWVHCDVTKNDWFNGVYKKEMSYRICYSKFNNIFCVSESVKKAFVERWGVFPSLSIMYNPIDAITIKKKSKDISLILKIDDKFKIISIGRLVPAKNFLRLFKAIERIRNEGYKIELWLLGTGEEENLLKAYINNHKLVDIIHMVGYQNNPYSLMSQCDLYACSSSYEGFSTAITEAIVLGIPVITTDVSGMREILGDGEYGLITDENDKAFEEGLKSILNDHELLEHYKRKAIERSSFFEFNSRIKDIEKSL